MVVVVVSSWSVVLVQGETCFDNITLIVAYEKLYSTADVLSLRRTYYLCPNMVFPMGVYNSSLGIWVDGNEPIVPRVNMTILCGLDGSSVNNCLLEGGWYGLVHANLFPERVEGVLIQGLTFQSQTLAAIDLQYDGNITFVDCIIEVRGIREGEKERNDVSSFIELFDLFFCFFPALLVCSNTARIVR